MRIYEIINETISFTKYTDDVTSDIVNGIVHGIILVSNNRDKLLARANQSNNIPKFLKDLKELTGNAIAESIKRDLKITANNIILDNNITKTSPIWVIFSDPPLGGGNDSAWVRGATISLPNRYIIDIVDNIINYIMYNLQKALPDRNKKPNNKTVAVYRENLILERLLNIMSKNSAIMQCIEQQPTIDNSIKKLSSLFIHELVHLRQNYIQHMQGRNADDFEYRSYLDKTPGEFNKLTRLKDRSERWKELYITSPQEMNAFAHNIALNIINDYGLSDPEIELPSQKEMLDKITSYVKKHYDKNNTPIDQPTYKRYIKQTYTVLKDYLEHIGA
jgi:hypothetical protein